MSITIFVDGLPHHFRKEHLLNLFGEFGLVKYAFVATRRSGQSLGFGYVIFSSVDQAQRAVRSLNGVVIMGQTLTLSIGESTNPQAGTG
jgi:RNA recognition motif-containing protein